MRTITMLFVFLFFSIIVFSQGAAYSTADSILNIPLSKDDGTKRSLSDLLDKSQTSLVVIWSLQACPPCWSNTVKKLHESIRNKEVKGNIITISILDSFFMARQNIDEKAFWNNEQALFGTQKEKFNWHFDNYQDREHQLQKALRIESYPVIYVLKDGKTVYHHFNLSAEKLIAAIKAL